MERRSGEWLIILAAAMWSSGGVLVKVLTGTFALAPEALVCMGSLAAGLVLSWALPSIRDTSWKFLAPAALAYAGMVLTFVMATANTSAANAVFLEYFSPLLLAGAVLVLKTDRLRPSTMVAMLVGTAGVLTIVIGSWNPSDRVGVLLGLACAALVTLFNLIQRHMRGSSIGYISFYNLLAAAILLPLAWRSFTWPGLAVIGLVLLMGTFQLGVPFALYVKGLRSVPVVEAALLTLLEPVLNPIWVWVFYGEVPGRWMIIGGVAIFGGLLVHVLTQRPAVRITPAAAQADVPAALFGGER